MSELKRLTIMWGGCDAKVRMADLPTDQLVNHLEWVIEMLKNPPKPYLTIEWIHETAEFAFTGVDSDPFSAEAQETGRLILADKQND